MTVLLAIAGPTADQMPVKLPFFLPRGKALIHRVEGVIDSIHCLASRVAGYFSLASDKGAQELSFRVRLKKPFHS